jgi:hypothetical protein
VSLLLTPSSQEAVVTPILNRVLLVSLALAAGTSQATAQTPSNPSSRSLVPAVFPRWDLSGSLGMLNISTADSGRSWRGWDQRFEYRADLGRYWTTHARTELSVGMSNGWTDFDLLPLAPGVAAPIYDYVEIERRLTIVAPAFTWQFRENTFMHPYVTGGANVGFLQEHRVVIPNLYRQGGQASQLPRFDEESTRVLVRPFLAGGFKSYISRSTFVRTEGRVAAGSTGARQVSLTAGVGFDF